MRVEYAVVHEDFDTDTGAVNFDVVHDYGEQLDLAQAKGEVDRGRYSTSFKAYIYDIDSTCKEDIVHTFTLYPREDVHDTYEATLAWWEGGATDVHHVKVTQTHYWHYCRFIDWRASEPVNTPHVLVNEEINGLFFVDRFETTDDEAWEDFVSRNRTSPTATV
jgi:hypothetical protein